MDFYSPERLTPSNSTKTLEKVWLHLKKTENTTEFENFVVADISWDVKKTLCNPRSFQIIAPGIRVQCSKS